MAFSEDVKNQAYRRAGGKCECRRDACGHAGRCNTALERTWEAHHRLSVSAGGADTLNNCEALCIRCHQNTQSFGRS